MCKKVDQVGVVEVWFDVFDQEYVLKHPEKNWFYYTFDREDAYQTTKDYNKEVKDIKENTCSL